MIDALIAGRIHRASQERTGANGKPYVTCVVRTAMKDGAAFVNCIAFDPTARATLLALSAGDSVALSGELAVKTYQPKDGSEPRPSLDLVAHAVLTEYHVTRKRRAVQDAAGNQSDAPFNDPLPAA
jgi:single-stranded DNA-binding protein